MEIGDNVEVVKGVHKGRRGIIKDKLFNEYLVKFGVKQNYWFDEDEIKSVKENE